MDAILSKQLESVQFLLEEASFPFNMHAKRGRHAACLAKDESTAAIYAYLQTKADIPANLDLQALGRS